MTTRIQQTISPIDGALYLERPLATPTQIDRTLASAVTAQAAWRRAPVAARVEICRRMAAWCVEHADHPMGVMTEESFGPVVGIMPVGSDEEAIRLMNDNQYGLTASIWTDDTEAALQLGDQPFTRLKSFQLRTSF